MKIGDKVRFLNTTGGGVVKGFQGKDIVLVEDQEGFDIPILIRETVVIEPTKDIQVKSPKPEEVFQVSRQVKEEEYKPEETKEGEQLGIYLAYLPNDIKSLSTTNLEAIL